MKKRAALVTMLLLCFLLSGCCLSHEWAAATCTAAETCSKCGETQGEALGHEWAAATCAAPETCSKCGETQGEVSEHIWLEANFRQPERCDVCGEENGEPLTTTLVKVRGDALYRMENHYIAHCIEKPDKIAVGTAETLIGEIVDGDLNYSVDELIEAAGVTPQEGYALVLFSTEVWFSDDNALSYGVDYKGCINDILVGDYYTHTVTTQENSDIPRLSWFPAPFDDYPYATTAYTVDMNEEKMPAFSFSVGVFNPDYSEGCAMIQYFLYIPEGYDGTVVGIRHAATEEPDSTFTFADVEESAVFYRLVF